MDILAAIPTPGTLIVLGLGLITLALLSFFRRRRREPHGSPRP
jgi:LPXTG-motif cell wall-anchored protein